MPNVSHKDLTGSNLHDNKVHQHTLKNGNTDVDSTMTPTGTLGFLRYFGNISKWAWSLIGMDDLEDTDMSSPVPSTGKIMRYEADNKWHASAVDLGDLDDVDLTSPVPANGAVLTYDSGSGKWKADNP